MGFENEGQILTAIETVALSLSLALKPTHLTGVLIPKWCQKWNGQYPARIWIWKQRIMSS